MSQAADAVYPRIIFISVCDNKYHGVCERMWRLPVFHALWCIAMTRCRAIRHAPQDSLRDPVNEAAVADDGGGEHRNRTHDYTRVRNAHLRSLASNSRARSRVANGCWARRVFSREISSRLKIWRYRLVNVIKKRQREISSNLCN